MRGSVRILLASVVVLLAMASTTHPAVTDSWYSDTDRISIDMEVNVPPIDIGFVFSNDGSTVNLENGLPVGDYVFTIEGAETMSFVVKEGQVTIDNRTYCKGESFLIRNGGTLTVASEALIEPIQ